MKFDENIAKVIYNLGHTLIQDDKADLGWLSYRNRPNHVYHGKRSPSHPSNFHHWQIGTVLCMLGQMMAIGALAQDVYDTPLDDKEQL